jgi:hypothetical protein
MNAEMKANVAKVREMFRTNPEAGRSSHLYNHYKRGMANVMKPAPSAHLALAAWECGFEAARS